MRERFVSRWIKPAVVYIAIPVTVAFLFVHQVFLFEDWYAYEPNDEVVHTFTGIPLYWRVLLTGSIPFINLYDNFGTPLIGDPVMNPFAPQALFYLLFDGPLAATVVKFLIVALTVGVLTRLYVRDFGLSRAVGAICAVYVVLTPHINYFLQHHPHQGAVLYFSCVLLAQRRFADAPTAGNALLLYGALLLFAVGLGVNGFAFGLLFVVARQLLLSGCRLDRRFVLFGALLGAVFLCTLPHFLAFVRWSVLSGRKALDFAALTPYTWRKLFTDLFFYQRAPLFLHVSEGLYVSLPVLLLVGAGCVFLFLDGRRAEGCSVLVLGVIPLAAVLALLGCPGLRRAIALLRPVDVTRFLWFATLFLGAGMGYLIERARRRRLSKGLVAVALVTLSLSTYIALWNGQLRVVAHFVGRSLSGRPGSEDSP